MDLLMAAKRQTCYFYKTENENTNMNFVLWVYCTVVAHMKTNLPDNQCANAKGAKHQAAIGIGTEDQIILLWIHTFHMQIGWKTDNPKSHCTRHNPFHVNIELSMQICRWWWTASHISISVHYTISNKSISLTSPTEYSLVLSRVETFTEICTAYLHVMAGISSVLCSMRYFCCVENAVALWMMHTFFTAIAW